MPSRRLRITKAAAALAVAGGTAALVYQPATDRGELPNRIPEAAPYVLAEAQFFPPPFEDYWLKIDHPGQCQSCHQRIFDEWNGSMMSNAWRDPVWRGAFLLAARQTSTDGNCATPDPPDGTAKARHNPFARDGDCASSYDLGDTHHAVTRSGSLLDGFCSRCHMPSNYVDNVPLQNVAKDAPSGLEHGLLDANFNPTTDNGTGIAFATVDDQRRNTESGRSGVFCAICHTMAETRDTPYHNYQHAEPGKAVEYVPAPGAQARSQLLPEGQRDNLAVPDSAEPNLGYAIGAGSFRLSPHAIGFPERLGPLTSRGTGSAEDTYLSQVFKQSMPYQQMDASKHQGYHQVMTTRSEFCSACHDVTNPMTVENRLGRWVGGFPIERTYTEWANSRYADRPGNRAFDPGFKRDCQTCHMQQDYGQPGTAQTLYSHGTALPPAKARATPDTPVRPHFTHHFVGGNAYITRMIGADVDNMGSVEPYPELSIFSFSSADKKSLYSNAYWTNVGKRGPLVQQARLAWDRLRNVLDLSLSGPRSVAPGASAPLTVSVTNSGSGHKFPTGFPEGRIAWLAVRAFDLASGRELRIHDSFWKRDSLGVGLLTNADMADPNYPRCHWEIPAGSPDPYAFQFKAVASLGDGCPTLDLVYASALNLVTNASGQPIDSTGAVIDRSSPKSLPQFRDFNGDGDLYDDSFLTDTRLRPLPNRGSTATLDRYAVLIPPGTRGPVAVSAVVYYQSLEAVVAKKLLGNLADLDTDFTLEPCVLGGACDGRTPSLEPAVVEGSPPVPMEVRNWVIQVAGVPAKVSVPTASTYPPAGATNAFSDLVVKAFFTEPMLGIDATAFTLTDSRGVRVPAEVDQIGDGTWGLFPEGVFLKDDEVYRARIKAGVRGVQGGRLSRDLTWSFRTSAQRGEGAGNTAVPMGFRGGVPAAPNPAPQVRSVLWDPEGGGALVATFSEPVMNVTSLTFLLEKDASRAHDCSALGSPGPGALSSNATADVWTFVPRGTLEPQARYCVSVTSGVYDLAGQPLPQAFRAPLEPAPSPGPRVVSAPR